MKRWLPCTLAAIALAAAIMPAAATAREPTCLRNRAAAYASANPWHGYYYEPGWGYPVALVVPPTAEYQTHWGWGVGNTRMTPIHHQFQPGRPGNSTPMGFQPTPAWPSDTDQFGVYYVRGPW